MEDHYFVAVELTSVLRKLGADVIGPVARLPLEDGLADGHIDVALVDIELRGGTSFELIDEMADRGVPVALVTGHEPSAIPLPYRGLPRLDKPVERDKLASVVLRLAGRTKGEAV